ncbi:LuxR C-terminal-related transcriptional regulator [Streptomyces sp. CA-249302]|uniref:LuxR C-terminal-related transcriptional regulator n=1 Tax=Streptomyces sp. CA-249302 TaxID=3240058 RepID=UPI003D8E4841
MTARPQRVGNLPTALTSFVGREPEVAKIRSLLGEARLVTLAGPGGVGKTRLALEAAAVAADVFPDGVWLVDLAPVREAAAVADAMATALGVPDVGARGALERLTGFLAARRTLIVLDNCEQVVEACAETAGTLLAIAPGLCVLATSRHTLGMTGEHVLVVPPLPQADGIRLLRNRAAAVRSGFEVTEANRAEAARLCAALDGLPLAIELAAFRLRTLTVGQVTERLVDGFDLLTRGSATARPHQRTLRDLIGWSYDLCSPAEQLLWNRLSVFAGGFGLDTVETVCGGYGIARSEVLDLLERLVVQSVVLITEGEGPARFRMPETIRRYGLRRLAESGEEEQLRGRHRDFFLSLARRVDERWYGPGQVAALGRLRLEHPNLLAALDQDVDPQSRLRLAGTLGLHWCVGGFLGEGRRQLELALAAAPDATVARGQALLAAVWVALTQGDLVAADRWLDEAAELGERLGDPVTTAQALGLRGASTHYHGCPQESIELYQRAWAALNALGEERQAVSWLLALSCVQAYAGDPRAGETGREVLEGFESDGERWGRAQLLMALGHHAWEHGDPETAGAHARSALENMRGFDDYAMVGRMLELLAWATASGGCHERAAGLMGAAEALWKAAGTALAAFGPRPVEHHERCAKEVAEALGHAAYEQALAVGGRHDRPCLAVTYALDPARDEQPGNQDTTASALPGPLTRRERQVAELVARGMSNRKIAAEFVVSPRTIDFHVENIRAKLGVGNRAQVAAWWVAQESSAP